MKITYIFILILVSQAILFCKIPASKKHEIRAVWMSRFEYAENKTPLQSQDYIRREFKQFREAGLNLIIFQIRGNADAFYKSKYEPWSDMLTGKLGEDPGWDPLEYAVTEAHHLGLELHAWINTFPAWKAELSPPTVSQPLHPLLAHPEWVVCDSSGQLMNPPAGYITFSPGIPDVQEHIRKVVTDIVTSYDVDGIHFDYIRYPESADTEGYSSDAVSKKRFADTTANPFNYDWNEWQREQINNFISHVYNDITQNKPWVKVSAAVLGHYSNVPWNGFHAVFQDAQRWLATGKVDLLFPMTYTSIKHPTSPYTLALEQWKFMDHYGRPIIPGIATYKVGEKDFGWKEIWWQMKLIREMNFPGMVFFSAGSLSEGLNKLDSEYYQRPSLTSIMHWKMGVPTIQIENLQCKVTQDSVFISWQVNNPAGSIVLYKNDNITDPESIVDILPGSVNSCHVARKEFDRSIFLTAVNRIGIESGLNEIKLESLAYKNE